MSDYLKTIIPTVSGRKTPQSEPILGKIMVQNRAGGYVFEISPWQRFERFLIIGTEGGTFYESERELTLDNAKNVDAVLRSEGPKAVARIVDVSTRGLALRQDSALFCLSMAASLGGDEHLETRKAAFAAVPEVCRTAGALLQFAGYARKLRGTGSGYQRAVSAWFNGQSPRRLAFQAIKYRQRDGTSLGDLLRICHPRPTSGFHDAIFRWLVDEKLTWPAPGSRSHRKMAEEERVSPEDGLSAFEQIRAFELLKNAESATAAANIVTLYNMPRESVPTQFQKSPEVWRALLPGMPLGALLRTLGRISASGVFAVFSDEVEAACAKIKDVEALKKARIHPLSVVKAARQYAAGKGERGHLTWEPSRKILDALDEAYYLAFDAVEPTGKRILLAVDCSGSMWSTHVPGMTPQMTSATAAALLALPFLATEPYVHVLGFDTVSGGKSGLYELTMVSAKMRADQLEACMKTVGNGGTDCSLPFQYAIKNKLQTDLFLLLTDNESWAGNIHAVQALAEYRRQLNSQARLAVLPFAANAFSVVDSGDPLSLNLPGFSPDIPAILALFARGEI